MSRYAEPLCGQVKTWKAEVPDLREGKSSLQGRLGGSQYGLGFGRFAITVQQVLNEERRVLGRSARLLRCLWHRCGCGLNAEDHGNRDSKRGEEERKKARLTCTLSISCLRGFPVLFFSVIFFVKRGVSLSRPESASKRTSLFLG